MPNTDCYSSNRLSVMENWLKLKLPKSLPKVKLPTRLDVIRAFQYEKGRKHNKRSTISEILDIITNKVQQVYLKSGIVTIRKDKIKEKVKKCCDSRLLLLKTNRLYRHTQEFSDQKASYLIGLSEFLDVADSNTHKDVKGKRSEPSSKQRSAIRVNEVEQGSQIRKEHYYECSCRFGKRKAALISHQKCNSTIVMEKMHNDDLGSTVNRKDYDDDFELTSRSPKTYMKRMDLSEIVEAQSRFSGSDRGTSAIVNATLRTFDIPIIIDRLKLRRAQKRMFSEIDNDPVMFGGGLFYDSRKDRTIQIARKRVENRKFKNYRKVVREEHCSLVSEPDGFFLGYITLKKVQVSKKNVKTMKPAERCAKLIVSFIKEKQLIHSLEALGCDGTNFNVGPDGGVNHFIEIALKRPLHWLVCLLHLNEIPLTTLVTKLDGPTTGVTSFSGPIGKALENVSNSPIVRFKKFVDAELLSIPDTVYKKLSNDQKYLYRIVNAIISGVLPKSLSLLKIGAINHSRWLTTASSLCRLWATTKKPSATLKTLVSYIVKVYAPTWFQIKKNELAINGPKNLFFLIRRINVIKDKNAKLIVQKCVQRNAFFAHCENMLLAQLASKEQSERADAVCKILKIREKIPTGAIRRFTVPKINFDANVWTDISTQNVADMTEPPLTINMNEDELLSLIQNPLAVPKFRCHTQMAERAVKEVTRVSMKTADHKKGNLMVKATLINRAKFPKLDSRKDFNQYDKSLVFFPKI